MNYDVPLRKKVKIGKYFMNYRVYGKGVDVVCLPAWMTNSYIFSPLNHELKSKYRLICPDIPGWGNDFPTNVKGDTLDFYIDIITEFVTKLKLTDYHLLGYSYGGVIAQGIIQQNKLNPKKVVLVSTLSGGHFFFNEKKFKLALSQIHHIKKLSKHQELLKKAYVFISKIHIAFSYLENSNLEFVDNLLKDLEKVSIDNGINAIYSLYNRSLISPNLADTETLLIRAENDHKSVVKSMTEISRVVNKKVHVIPNVNHHHLVFKAAHGSKLIDDFLSK